MDWSFVLLILVILSLSMYVVNRDKIKKLERSTKIDNNYAEFCWLTHRTRGVRRAGAASIDLAYVASGKVDGYWERGLSKWDMAAGIPIVEMAGGIISNYPNEKYDLNNGRILACTKGIKTELMDELSKVKPLDSKSIGSKEH